MRVHPKQILIFFIAVVIILATALIFVQLLANDRLGNQEDSENNSLFSNIFSNPISQDIDLSIEAGDELSEFARALISGGPPPDGIPPVDEPVYISVTEADEILEDASPVFIADVNGDVKIFPQEVMVWHEIVNDTIGGEELSVTYCPLTGTAIGYKNQFNEVEADFGTSGRLLNNNLVMYDRDSQTLWPQILGTGITSDHRGVELDAFPVVWADWGDAKTVYPEAEVLSRDTGFIRSYGFDPYGSYLEEGTYYDSGDPLFPIMHEDDRLPAKEIVVAIKVGEEQLAVTRSKVEAEGVVYEQIGETEIVLLWDDALKTSRVFERMDDQVFTKLGNIFTDQNGVQWNANGSSLNGEERLTWVTSFDSMWFPWAAYYPETRLTQ